MDIRYSYAHVPTIREFAASNARVRGLVGPFRCLPGDTEFLTPTGWKRIDGWQDGDLVAQWHRSGEIEFVEPTAYVNQPAPEGFIQFDSGSHVMRLSPDHRVPHHNWNGEFQVKTAAEIARRPSRRKLITTFEPPVRDGIDMSDDLIRFAVMMHADGHYPRQGRRALICVRKERKKIRIRYLLSALGVEWRERTYPKRPTETTFSFEPPYVGKRYDAKWWAASKHQLRIIVEEMVHWDGGHYEGGGGPRFFSAFKADADFIQYAGHSMGFRAALHTVEYPDKPRWLPTHIVHFREGYKNCATIREECNITKVPASDGRQYCFQVPTGFFLARCDDAIFVTGNSGKSSGCVVEIVRRAQAQRPGPDGTRRTRWLVVRNTYSQLSDTTIPTTQMWLPPQYFGRYYQSDHRYVVKGFQGVEFEILFRALDKPDQVANLLSLEVTGAWINEAREVPWAIVDAIQGRIEQYPPKAQGGCTWGGLFMDTNPPDQDSDWYRFFEEKKHPDWFAKIFRQPSGRGPNAENIPNLTNPNYYKLLAEGKKPEWIKVYCDGEYGFVVDGKPVYEEYSDQLHRRDVDPIPGKSILRSWDFGLTPACAFSQLLPDGRWLVFDEMTSKSMGFDQFSDDVLEHCRRSFKGDVRFEDYADPAGNQRAQTDKRTCFEIASTKGIDMQPSEQDPTLRMESVRKPLRTLTGGEPQFILHPRCKMIRKGFLGGYNLRRIQVAGPERFASRPDKGPYSHIMNALEYAAAQLFAPALTRGSSPSGGTDWPETGYGPEGARSDEGRSEVTGY